MNWRYMLMALGLLLITNMFSQDSLEHYLLIAAKNNPNVLQKLDEYQAALQKVPQAGSLSDPEISAGFLLRPMELVMGKQVAEFRLMQMFPWFGTLRSAKDEMSLMANSAYESFIDAKLQVFYELQTNWYNLYKVRQNIRISERSIILLQSIENIALARFGSASSGNARSSSASQVRGTATQGNPRAGAMDAMNGSAGGTSASEPQNMPQNMQGNTMTTSPSGSLSDLYRIHIETADLTNKVLLLEAEFQTLTAKFNGFLNRDPRTPVALPDTLIPDSLSVTFLVIPDSLLVLNPMLKMLDYEMKSLEARKGMVRKMGYPMFGLGLNYSLISKNEMVTSEMNGKDMVMPMISMTLPVYRKKYKSMQSEVDFQKSSVSRNYSATANNLRTEYFQAIQSYMDAKRRISLYGNQRELTQRTLNILIQGFAVNGSDLTDVLRVRQQLLEYDYRQTEAVTDFNIAVAWLNRLLAHHQTK